jgi:hypothetical protein
MSGPRYHRPQPAVPDLELLVIDGDNLLHRVRGMRDEAGIHWLLPRLRAWRPPEVRVILMLDGSPGPGVGRRQQVVPGIQMQHSGRIDADTAIVDLVRARGYAERARTVVVTDDRQLADRVRYGGVLVRRLDWLVDQLSRPNPPSDRTASPVPAQASGPASSSASAPSPTASSFRAVGIGGGRPPRTTGATTPSSRDPDGTDPQPWKPGRGATTKRGNPRRTAKGPPA